MKKALFVFVLLAFLFSPQLFAQSKITTPQEAMGLDAGEDYFLASYSQLSAYWKTLTQESDRISLQEIGKTAEGRTMLMAVITSPENHGRIGRYKTIARRMALAEGLDDAQAQELAKEGRAVVWIDGGLHGTEVLGSQQLIELVYQMVSQNDPETLRILDNVILLAICSNPDGMELVADWYMREPEPTKRSTRGLPRLYHKYIGHDNNRDFYMSTQVETEALNHILYRDWFPQIVYNHHQSGPSGCVLFAPPFRDPFNYCYDPLVPVEIQLLGAAMHTRFVQEEKPGATMRSGASYSIWWNGGLRTTVYFHNMIGILTETIGNPTPMDIPFLPDRQLPNSDYPYPVAPQKWHFRRSVEYSMTADRAILDFASKHREEFLLNIYRMGKNSIARGSRDNWTIVPKNIEGIQAKIEADRKNTEESSRFRGIPLKYYEMLHDPELRDPRGFIIPSDQPDFLTATKYVNTLIKNGIVVHQATREFEIAGKTYPAGSYVVKCAQAFRPHILSMFEPQHYPDDIPCPGESPRPTYDMAGWTLAFQMGVQFDRIMEGFDGPLEEIADFAQRPEGEISRSRGAEGFLLDHRINDAFIATNRLLANNEEVYWLKQSFEANGKTYAEGSIYIPNKASTLKRLKMISDELGLRLEGTAERPSGEALHLRPLRIGLWDRYGGSIASGWIRWLFEQFEFPHQVVYPNILDAGDLIDKFDVLVFVSGAIPRQDTEGRQRYRRSAPLKPEEVPEKYRDRLGEITVDKTVPQILRFLKEGGTVLTIGSSTDLGFLAGLPIKNGLVEKSQDGTENRLSSSQIFIPGSLLQVRLNPTHPLTYGMGDSVDVVFDRSPVFQLKPEAQMQGVHPIAWFDSAAPLKSGWAWGQHYLEGGIAVLEASLGKGKLVLYGPEIAFRGQPHGTFKLLFNGLYYGSAETVRLK